MKRAYLFSTKQPNSKESSGSVYYVYVLFDWHGTPRYVGKGKRARWNWHGKVYDKNNPLKSKFVAETLNKLGEIPKLKIREKLSDQEARDLEILLITTIGRHPYGPLTNLTDGGDGIEGYAQTEAVKLALSNAQKGVPETSEAKAAVRLAAQQPERIAKIVAALTGRKQSPEHREKNRLKSLGNKHSLETRQKMSESHSGEKNHNFGKSKSPEIRAKISAAKMGQTPWNKGQGNNAATLERYARLRMEAPTHCPAENL